MSAHAVDVRIVSAPAMWSADAGQKREGETLQILCVAYASGRRLGAACQRDEFPERQGASGGRSPVRVVRETAESGRRRGQHARSNQC